MALEGPHLGLCFPGFPAGVGADTARTTASRGSSRPLAPRPPIFPLLHKPSALLGDHMGPGRRAGDPTPPNILPQPLRACGLDSPSPGLGHVERPGLLGRQQLAEGRRAAHLEEALLALLLHGGGRGTPAGALFPKGGSEREKREKWRGRRWGSPPTNRLRGPTLGGLYAWAQPAQRVLTWAQRRCFCEWGRPASGGPAGGARCFSPPSLAPGGTAPGKTPGPGGGVELSP